MARERDPGPATVTVRNVGGIDAAELSVPPGLTVLAGENATNRTSLLTAITGALGGSRPNLKSDADEGEVSLEMDGTTYTRRYRRRGGSVHVDGEPFTDEADLVDLFVCLLEDNPTRRAVERGDDLRELVMAPIDTAEIDRRLADKRAERDRLRERAGEIDRRIDRLPELEERHESLTEELESVEARIDALADAENGDPSPAVEAAEERIQELERLQRERREAEASLDTERSSLEALRQERASLEAELEDLACRDEELAEIEDEVEALRDRERELTDAISDLTAINQFNRELLSGDAAASWADPDGVVDQLDPVAATLECWTCGSRIDRAAVRERLEELERATAERREERTAVRDRIDTLRERGDELRAAADRRERVETRLEEIETEIDERTARIQEHEATIATLDDRIDEVDDRIGSAEDLDEHHRERYAERSDLEYERGRLEGELCELERDIEALRELADEREQIDAQLAEVESELECLRSHVEETERAAVETFNEHVEEVLALLDYENVARVWIERTVPAEGTGRESSFDLHVVRDPDGGPVYEDTVANLSESEREVIGLVVGLAGYLVHDVAEEVPVMLLDSLEAIDGERIAALLDYFAEFVPYLVVALLPEDAAAIDRDHERIPASAIQVSGGT